MASFCKQCSTEIFGRDFGDFKRIAAPIARTAVFNALCEGCGPTLVNWKGKCMFHKGRTSKECLAGLAEDT